jgi:hypothetical protein
VTLEEMEKAKEKHKKYLRKWVKSFNKPRRKN